jgi:hypothetical protein
MITTGSVRGKCCARHTGQSRRQPASTRSVAAPHDEQKRCRPCQLSSALPSASEVVRLDQAAHRNRAQIGHDEFLARFEHFGGLRLERDRESRRVAVEPEKDDLRRGAERARLRQREQRIANGARVLEDHRVAGDQIGTRVLILRERRERGGVRAPLARALERAIGVTETRLGAEIGARRHAIAPAGHRCWPGPAVLCHVEGSQSKRIRHAQTLRCARACEVGYPLALREARIATCP